MFNLYFFVLLLGHIISDFYMQHYSSVYLHEKIVKRLFLHAISYYVILTILSVLVMTPLVAILNLITTFVHIAIRFSELFAVKFLIKNKRLANGITRNIFISSQTLHLLYFILFSYFLHIYQVNIIIYSETINKFLIDIGIKYVILLKWIVILLIIHKPINYVISLFLAPYKPDSKDEGGNNDRNSGRFIGTVERLIILLLIYIKQYSAIGLVLTAKSIARYDKITKDPTFSEYYLLGTLLSALSVIAISFIL
ncbi:MAG: DUF3307 domain-containing protein [Eubacteriales bacterium]